MFASQAWWSHPRVLPWPLLTLTENTAALVRRKLMETTLGKNYRTDLRVARKLKGAGVGSDEAQIGRIDDHDHD
jgi:hypothetical protein